MQPQSSRISNERSAPAFTERTVTLLGATGSIGASTVDLLKRERERYRVEAVSANTNAAALAALAREVGARFAAVVLILFVAAATFYFHDFWNQTGADARNNLVQSLKNLSIIGALLIIAGTTRLVPLAKPAYDV